MLVHDYQTLRVTHVGRLVWVVLDRPDVAHAVDARMAAELRDLAERCCADDVGAVVLTSTGNFFCAGGDLAHFADLGPRLPDAVAAMAADMHAALSAFARMDAPLIAAVNGTAAGAGLAVVCACDLAYAADSARFVSGYTGAGLTPDAGATYSLPRHVGLRRAQELVLTNRVLSAAEALEWGLLTAVLPGGELQDHVRAVAETVAAGPTSALGTAKRLLHTGWAASLDVQTSAEADALVAAAGSAHGQEGIAAFLAKRRPTFRHR